MAIKTTKKTKPIITIRKGNFQEFQFYYGEYAKYSVLGSAIQEGKATFYLVLADGLYMKDFWTYNLPDGVLELGILNGPMKQTILDKRYFPAVLSYFQKEKIKSLVVMLVLRIHDIETEDASKKQEFLEHYGFVPINNLQNDEVSMVQLQYSYAMKKDD